MKKNDVALVCMRVRDLPTPPVAGVIGRCDDCKERIWISHTSPRTKHQFCFACIKAKGGNPKVAVTRCSLAEAVDYLRRKGQIV